eukprot:TRINITY_DN4165_c0_g1_i1.p1 TRINITY_DN4165_c0_g1~~TRINITY_DN4165_c0_g1_i1.p1  ORF type:complete len:1310 (-),score=284.25 TRINITY_DN4165_c0_g1_i1:308-4237(-)
MKDGDCLNFPPLTGSLAGMGCIEEGSMPVNSRGCPNQDTQFDDTPELVELLKNLQNVKTDDDEGSRHKEDTSLQEVPPPGEHGNGKLKFMCSFGGRILPRPSDGKLRYVGGQTRIISVNKGINFSELMQKLVNAYGQSLVLKYQLPDEELDSLVSVTCDEDLQNMIEEYGRHPVSNDGPRIRLFLSSVGDQQYFDVFRDKQDSHQQYVEAVNDVVEMGMRSSSENGSRDSWLQAERGLSYEFLESPAYAAAGELASRVTSFQDIISPSLQSAGVPISSEHLTAPDLTTFVPVRVPSTSNQTAPQDPKNPLQFPVSVLPSSEQTSRPVSVPSSLPSSMPTHAAQPAMVDMSLAPFAEHPTNVGRPLSSVYQHDLQYGVSDPATSEANFQRIEQLDKRQLPDQHEIPILNLTSVVSQPSSSPILSSWQTGFENKNLQQAPQQQSTTSLVHLGVQQVANVDATNFRQATQSQVLSNNVLNDAPIHNVISTQQTGHYIASSDATSLGFSVQQIPSHMYNFNENLILYNYNDQGGGVFDPSVSAAKYCTVSSEPVPSQSLFANDQQHYGMQPALSNKQTSHLNNVFSQQHAPVAPYSEANPKIISTTYERALQPDESVMSIPSYAGLSTMQDDMVPYNAFQNINVQNNGGNQQGNEAKQISSGLPLYTMNGIPAEYGAQTPTMYSYYHEASTGIGDLDSKRMTEQDHINGQYFTASKATDGGRSNQQASHLIGSHPLMSPREGYFDTHLTDEGKAAVGTEFVVSSKAMDDKNAANHVDLVQPFPENLQSAEHARHTKETMHPNYGNRASDLNNVNPYAGYYGKQQSSWGSLPDHDGLADPCIVLAPEEENLMFGTGEGNLEEDKNHVANKNLSASGFEETSKHITIESIIHPVDEVASVNEIVKDSGSLSSLQQDLPSSGSVFAFMVGNASESPNVPADNSVSHGPDPEGTSPENIKPELLSPTLRTTENAFQSPIPNSQGITNGDNQQGADGDNIFNDEASNAASDIDPVTDARIAEFEAVARGLQVIKNADLEELQELGSGTFGTVYHGKWRGTDVAIKRIKNSCFTGRPSQQENMRADFWSEASLLAQLHHPNILAFYGVVPDGPGGTLGTVTEYMVNGSLKHVLQRKDRPIDHRKRVLIAMDAAFGMEYLHTKNIVHFDIKCENLLVNMRDPQRPICKVGDFGLSKIKHQTFVSGGVRGTLPWIAPELLHGTNNMVSEKVDVYSFGIVMWELLTGEEPYADMHYGAIIGGILSNSLRPSVPDNCDPQWRALMEACWSSDPFARPSFAEVVSRLRAMAATLQSKTQEKKQA